ncbi:MAG TPA: GspE/PulE family protein [Bacteroidota bacterium]|nr:GspE/PulE family protein [Bacteroidota bacterium]
MSTTNDGEKKKSFLSNISNSVGIGAKTPPGDGTQHPSGNQRPAEIIFEDQNLIKPKSGKSGSGAKGQPGGNAGASPSAPESKKLPTMRLQDVLVKEGVATKETVEKAFEIQRTKQDKRRLIDILIDDLNVDRDALYSLVARHYSFEVADPTAMFEDKERLKFIRATLASLPPRNYETAVKMKILPFELLNGSVDKLILITPDTTHPEVHTVARAFGYQKYEIRYVALGDYTELWRQLAFDQGAKQLGLESDSELSDEENEKEMEKSLEDEIGRGKLNELIENLLTDGTRTGASDIHVIPKGPHRVEFHFRIDGRLSLWSAITDVRAEAVLTVIKDRAKNLDRFEKLLSQDGFAQRMIDNKMIRFRFSTMPIYGTDLKAKLESIVIRILRGAEASGGLGALGMPSDTLGAFLKAIRKPQGMVVFTGPTGSGKSTSQLAAIQTIMDPGINIITIEDPVEYLIEGCRQVKLNHKLDFEGALRGLLRHDPDVVMVGEMRDKITADLAVKLANTGHLIFSTLHTNDSIGAITRLYNMGIEPFLLAYTINIVVAQRLIRKLCERCKVVDENVDSVLLVECGFTEQEIQEVKFYKPVGCVHCIRGFRGRIGIYESLVINKELRRIILKSQDFIDEEAMRVNALANGMQTIRQMALRLVKDGVTSLENVEGLVLED